MIAGKPLPLTGSMKSIRYGELEVGEWCLLNNHLVRKDGTHGDPDQEALWIRQTDSRDREERA